MTDVMGAAGDMPEGAWPQVWAQALPVIEQLVSNGGGLLAPARGGLETSLVLAAAATLLRQPGGQVLVIALDRLRKARRYDFARLAYAGWPEVEADRLMTATPLGIAHGGALAALLTSSWTERDVVIVEIGPSSRFYDSTKSGKVLRATQRPGGPRMLGRVLVDRAPDGRYMTDVARLFGYDDMRAVPRWAPDLSAP